MKKALMAIAMLTVLLSLAVIPCTANASDGQTPPHFVISEIVIPSTPVGNTEIDIPTIIGKLVTEENVKQRYALFSVERPEEFTYDPSVYILDYMVSTQFWSKVSEDSYRGVAEAISSRPTVYIPLFAEIADTEGVPSRRVIGYIKLSYEYTTQNYKFGMSLYNLANTDYRDEILSPFYEKIEGYLEESKTSPEQVFVLRHTNSLGTDHEIAAVIASEDGTVILDLSDCLQLTSEVNVPTVAYSVEEFRTRRLEAEKELYKNAGSWENVQFGGSGSSGQSRSDTVQQWIPYVLIGGLVLGAGATVLILRKGRANKA